MSARGEERNQVLVHAAADKQLHNSPAGASERELGAEVARGPGGDIVDSASVSPAGVMDN